LLQRCASWKAIAASRNFLEHGPVVLLPERVLDENCSVIVEAPCGVPLPPKMSARNARAMPRMSMPGSV